MTVIEDFMTGLADLLWGNWMLYLLLGLGVYYSVVTGGIQIRALPCLLRELSGRNRGNRKGLEGDAGKAPGPGAGNVPGNGARDALEGDAGNTLGNVAGDASENAPGSLSSVQALCTAVASCVGSGNIVGVATALIAGGPGAMFWMWLAAFFGMATKYGEIVLGICTRERDGNGAYMGGPMYYISKGLHAPWLGTAAALLLFLQNAGATMIQSNTISSVAQEVYQIPRLLTGLVLAIAMSFIIQGGLKRLASTAQRIVPVMSVLYILGGAAVVLSHMEHVIPMFQGIVRGAFSLEAGMGAAAGITMREAMRFGVARGLYSNEAGEGSAAVIHSSAQVDHPSRQGIYGVAEVFIDTMVICSTTGFAILSSGISLEGASAATLAAAAFSTVFPALKYVVSVSLILFASTSIMSQWYFGHVSLVYMKSRKGDLIYRLLFPVLILYGSLSTVSMVWAIQDCMLGLLIIPNVIALFVLSPQVRRLTKDFYTIVEERRL